MAKTERSGHTTTDHDFIRGWVEERGGWPARVAGTEGGDDDAGLIRIDFPGYSGEGSLEKIEWEEWFQKFDDSELAFLHRDMSHGGGDLDRFNKLVRRGGDDNDDESESSSRGRSSRGGSKSSSSKSSSSKSSPGSGSRSRSGASSTSRSGGSKSAAASDSASSSRGGSKSGGSKPGGSKSGSSSSSRSTGGRSSGSSSADDSGSSRSGSSRSSASKSSSSKSAGSKSTASKSSSASGSSRSASKSGSGNGSGGRSLVSAVKKSLLGGGNDEEQGGEMRELLKHELGDLLFAEKVFLKGTKTLAREAQDAAVKERLEEHVRETEGQIERLNDAFRSIGEKPKAEKCDAALGLQAEHDSFKSEEKPSKTLLSAFDLGSGLRVEHYEIAAYRTAIAVATAVGERECAAILKENLNEELAMASFLEKNALGVLRALAQA